MDLKITENQTNSEHTPPDAIPQAPHADFASRHLRTSIAQKERSIRGRLLAATVVARSAHLPEDEAVLLRAIYERGMKQTELARAMGCRPRVLRRRLQNLVRRIIAPTFAYVLVHREQWPDRTRRLATELFLHGRPMKHIADACGSRYHTVRRQRDAISSMAATWHAANTLPPTKPRSSITSAPAIIRKGDRP
ncbi:MAG: hypothetical protein ACREJO_17640 [Phycisphaerales bacterium]